MAVKKLNPNLTKTGKVRLGTLSVSALIKLSETCTKKLKDKINNRLKLM
jgi:hypothetical protein